MDVVIDTNPLLRYLDDFEQRQVPFALANTLNDVAKLAQYREREHVHSIFTVRRAPFVDNSIKITKFATKRDLTATLVVSAPGGRSDILGKFESSTSKTPAKGGRSIVVPADAKRSSNGIIPQSARPKAFNFKRVGGARAINHGYSTNKSIRGGIGRGALEVYEGDRKTVMIRNAQGKGVVLQRVGRGKRAGMRVLFYLTPRVKLTPNLGFVKHAQEAVTHAADFFKARFAEAMATAKR